MSTGVRVLLVVLLASLAVQSRSDASSTLPEFQYGQQVPPALSGSSQVVVNTEMHAVLNTPLSNRTSRPGDRFDATITDPVRAGDGMVVVPSGSRVEGEVVEGDEADIRALHGKGMLNLRFRDVVLPGGRTLPIAAVLVSVNNTSVAGVQHSQAEGPSSSLIFGSPLKGLAVGELRGGGYVLAKKSTKVDLPPQTGVVIRLVQPLLTSPEPPDRGSNQPPANPVP